MPFDIFVSYAHHDNDAHKKWVEHFCARLAADFRSRSGKKLNIFLDTEDMHAGNVLPARLQGALEESRVFLPILSPAYLSSDWCRREFLHFLDNAGEAIVNGNSRILPVQVMPYGEYEPEEASRNEVGRITGFLKENEVVYADFFQGLLPIAPEERAFSERIARLSIGLYQLLKGLKEAARIKENPGPAGSDALFLAYTASGSRAVRDGLLKELQQQRKYGKIDFRILPDEAPDHPEDLKALPAAELEAFMRRQLEASAFSIHLFDDIEGVKTPDTREPLTHLQYRLAKETAGAHPQFQLFTAQSVTEECATSQEQFLETIAADARKTAQLEELPAFEVKAIKDFLLEKIQLREEKQEEEAVAVADDAPRRLFFIHDHRDKGDPICTQLDDLIYAQKYDVYVPVFREDDPQIDPDASFRDFWLVCNKAVILLRNATTAWCNAIKVELIKAATEKKAPYAMAICVTDPGASSRIREVRSHEFRVINCAREGYEQELIQFLNPQAHA
ncbi:MAG: toll/interleukin-1 receptor domain-containing protein [Phaeodactylibacter sp.]|nr:toll/interleukin-1 receptor domain-containing protein [Phaeodactylibacter sp.]